MGTLFSLSLPPCGKVRCWKNGEEFEDLMVDHLMGLVSTNITRISLKLHALSMLSCPELDQIVNGNDANEIIFQNPMLASA